MKIIDKEYLKLIRNICKRPIYNKLIQETYRKIIDIDNKIYRMMD